MADTDHRRELYTRHMDEAQRTLEAADQIFLRLSSWLVAGHGVTTLLLLNAMLDGKLCVTPELSSSATFAFFGLLSAFAAAALTRWSLLADADYRREWALFLVSKNAEAMPSRTMPQRFGRLAFAALFTSAVVFVFNLYDALSLDWLAASACPLATPPPVAGTPT